MSATKFTASVTDANSSGRMVRNRKIGRSASLRTTYRSRRSVSSSAHWTSSMSSASGRMRGERRDRDAREVEGPQELGVRRQGLESRLVAPGDGLDHASTAASAGVPAAVSRMAVEANRLRATRNGPRISSSAVIATHVNPLADASSAAASSRRVLPMPGSPSRVTAARRPDASCSSWEIASSSALRPMTAPVARRSWTASEHWGPTRGSSAPPSPPRDVPGSIDVTSRSMPRSMTPGGRLAR